MTSIRLTACFAIAIALAACGKAATDDESRPTPLPQATADAPVADTEVIESVEIMPGLNMRLLREGGGAMAERDQYAVVHYTGWLYDENAQNNRGKKFDSSIDRGEHFEFLLGAGKVIRGWDEGVVGMKVGEVRELTIAPELAYGSRQVGDVIPAGSTLVFEVELANLKDMEGNSVAP